MPITQRLRPWMFVSAAWVVVAGIAALDEMATRRFYGNTWALHDIIFAGSGGLLTLALMTPAVFAVSRRWPISGPHVARRAALHLGFALVYWIIVSIIFQGVLAGLFNPHATAGSTTVAQGLRQLAERVIGWMFNTLPFIIAMYASGIGIEHAIRYFAEARERELQLLRMSEQLTGAHYAALQSQLNPHFLFNTLNSIVVRARSGDGAATARMAEQLSEVLRRTLGRHRANEVTVDDELDLVQGYLAIEQARFSDRLRPTFAIDDAVRAAAVPSFALQHLVENAIRHGIARRPNSGVVTVAVRRDGEMLELSVSDDGPGVGAGASSPAGHGIDNTKARLRALYGDHGTFALTGRADGGAIATLRVPYREMVLDANVA